MADKLQLALDAVGTTYEELVAISDDIVSRYATDIDAMVKGLESLEIIPNDELRDRMVRLSLKSYSLGEAKEHAALKSEIAESLMKEKQATITLSTDGTVDTKKNTALLNSAEETLVNLIYEQVASQLARRLDEAHRIVDVMKSTLVSRAAEAKLTQITNEGLAM